MYKRLVPSSGSRTNSLQLIKEWMSPHKEFTDRKRCYLSDCRFQKIAIYEVCSQYLFSLLFEYISSCFLIYQTLYLDHCVCIDKHITHVDGVIDKHINTHYIWKHFTFLLLSFNHHYLRVEFEARKAKLDSFIEVMNVVGSESCNHIE